MELFDLFTKYSPVLLNNGQIRMKCPFRENHTSGDGLQSMFITPDINAYHCFSCNAHGTIVKLLTSKFGLGAFEALQYVSVKIATSLIKKEDDYVFEIKDPWVITDSDIFTSRGILKSIQKRFKVGVDKSGNTIIPYLFMEKIIAVQTRTGIDKKVRFQENTPGFRKSNYLYNYTPENSECVLVEGYTDVFRLAQFEEFSEGLWGSSFSAKQAELLSVHKLVYVATDNDAAGRRCLEVIAARMKEYKTKLKIIQYPTKDPGECTSRRIWKHCKSKAITYEQYYYEQATKDENYEKFVSDIKNSILNYQSFLE